MIILPMFFMVHNYYLPAIVAYISAINIPKRRIYPTIHSWLNAPLSLINLTKTGNACCYNFSLKYFAV
jgi:hypothetical protein